MNFNDEAMAALSCHLSTEIECLSALLDALEAEADALCRMSLEDLGQIATQKENAVNRHAQVARRRAALLSAGDDEGPQVTFSHLISTLDLSDDHEFVQKVQTTRRLAAEVRAMNERNRLFAQSGHGLVSGLVRLIDIWRSPKARTYAPNGHIRSSVLEMTPRGPDACSV